MPLRTFTALAALACLAFGAAAAAPVQPAVGAPRRADGTRSGATRLQALPLAFEPTGEKAGGSFLACGSGCSVSLTASGPVLHLPDLAPAHPAGEHGWHGGVHDGFGTAPGRRAPHRLELELAGANPHPRLRPEAPLPGRVSRVTGQDSRRWTIGLPTYGRVRYAGVYPGIDLVFHGAGREIEYDFVVAPGRDPARIALRLKGSQGLKLDAAGNLHVSTPAGELVQRKPVAYQEIHGRRLPVPCAYRLEAVSRQDAKTPRDGKGGHFRKSASSRTDVHSVHPVHPVHSPTPNTQHPTPSPFSHSPILPFVSFTLGRYDHRQPLVIDPVLEYSTYYGTALAETVRAVATDGDGNLYLAGDVAGDGSGDPAQAFVAKLNPDGTELLWKTEFGGAAGADVAYGAAVSPSGRVCVTGQTFAPDFPTLGATQGALGERLADPGAPDGADAFVFVLQQVGDNGAAPVFSTFLGGAAEDGARAVAAYPAADPEDPDYFFVCGQTFSGGPGQVFPRAFPIASNAPQPLFRGRPASGDTPGVSDGFVTTFGVDGSGAWIPQSTYLGDPGGPDAAHPNPAEALLTDDLAYDLALDAPSGFLYVVGESLEPSTGGARDGRAFIDTYAQLGQGAVSPQRTVLDTAAEDLATGVAVFRGSTAALGVCGFTLQGSGGQGFLVTHGAGAPQVTSLPPGSDSRCLDVAAVHNEAPAFALCGTTASSQFPVVKVSGKVVQDHRLGDTDGFVTVIRAIPNGDWKIRYSTYLGGLDGSSSARALAAHPYTGDLFVAGATSSGNFRVLTTGESGRPYQANPGGGLDGFACRIACPLGPGPLAVTLLPAAGFVQLQAAARLPLGKELVITRVPAFPGSPERTAALVPDPAGALLGYSEYQDRQVAAGKSYTYTLVQRNEAGLGASASGKATPLPTGRAKAPTRVSARLDGFVVALTWAPGSAPDGTGFYRILRRDGSGTVAELPDVLFDKKAKSYGVIDNTVLPGITYTYQVVATNGVDEASVAAAPVTLPAVPVPTGVKATAPSESQVVVTWGYPASPTAVGFRVELLSGDSVVQRVEVPEALARKLVFSAVPPDQSYVARVTAVFRGVDSAPALSAPVTPAGDAVEPPTGLSWRPGATPSEVLLEWAASPAPGVTYQLTEERWAGIRPVDRKVTTLPFASGGKRTTELGYLYRWTVVAVRSGTRSAPSNEARLARKPGPIRLTVHEDLGHFLRRVRWKKPTGSVNGYVVKVIYPPGAGITTEVRVPATQTEQAVFGNASRVEVTPFVELPGVGVLLGDTAAKRL